MLLTKRTGASTMDIVGPSGQMFHLEGIKPAGFLDNQHYPVSPRSESAYADITAVFDRLFNAADECSTALREGSGLSAGRDGSVLGHRPYGLQASADVGSRCV